MHGSGNVRGRKRSVESHGLLHRIQVRPAIGAALHMLPDFTTLRRVKLLVDVVTNVVVDVGALLHGSFFRVVMYGVSSFRRNARALLNRDFVASTEIFRI